MIAGVLAVCIWAVLHQQVQTGVVGTTSLSLLGMCMALRLLQPGAGGGCWATSQAVVHISLASLLVWAAVRYRRRHGAKRGRV